VIRFFRHYVPLNLLLLVMLEALILCGAMYLGVSARFLDSHAIPDDLNPLLPKATTFTLVMLGLMTASGLYDLESRGGIRALLQRLGLSFGLGLVTMSLLFYFFPALLVGRGAFLLAFGRRCSVSWFPAPCSSAGRASASSKNGRWSSAPAAAPRTSRLCWRGAALPAIPR